MKLEKIAQYEKCRRFLFKTKATFQSCFLIAIVKILIQGRHNGSPILQPKYFILQPNERSLVCFSYVKGARERDIVPATKRHRAIAIRWFSRSTGQSPQDITPAA